MDKIYGMVNGIEYNRDIPKEAKEYARENGFIVIVGGSDDLMYAFGAESYLASHEEHSYGWDGDTLKDISDSCLEYEAKQLGLEIFWCGINSGSEIKNYEVEDSGAFSYKVNKNIEYKDFTVYENEKQEEIYCTGIIIKLPNNFKPADVGNCDE